MDVYMKCISSFLPFFQRQEEVSRIPRQEMIGTAIRARLVSRVLDSVGLHILSYLTLKELKCIRGSENPEYYLAGRSLRVLVKNAVLFQDAIKMHYAPFGKEDWKRVGIYVNPPPLPDNVEKILRELCPFTLENATRKTIRETHLLFYMPAEESPGVSLTFNRLGELFKRTGQRSRYAYNICKDDPLGNKPVDSGWYLMLKNIWSKSVGLSRAEQILLISSVGPYALPKMSVVAAGVFLYESRCGKCLLGRSVSSNRTMISRCAENIRGIYSIVIGDFAPSPRGLCINDSFYDLGNYGVLPTRRLTA